MNHSLWRCAHWWVVHSMVWRKVMRARKNRRTHKQIESIRVPVKHYTKRAPTLALMRTLARIVQARSDNMWMLRTLSGPYTR